MRKFAFFGAKSFGFSKSIVCLQGQGGEVNFWRFCAEVFYVRLLSIFWTLFIFC